MLKVPFDMTTSPHTCVSVIHCVIRSMTYALSEAMPDLRLTLLQFILGPQVCY